VRKAVLVLALTLVACVGVAVADTHEPSPAQVTDYSKIRTTERHNDRLCLPYLNPYSR